MGSTSVAGHDSIGGFEAAAERRYSEARALLRQQRLYAAIYLFGYAIEMWMKAAYFRNEGTKLAADPISLSDLHHAWQHQAAAGITTGKNLHDFAGWAHLLIYIRGAAGLVPPYTPAMRIMIQNMADAARQHWDPAMRYRHLRLLPGEANVVARAAAWFKMNYNAL